MPSHSRNSRSCVVPAAAEDLDIARRGRQQSFEDLDGRGLARAVRPEQAEALAGLDGQVEPANRFDFAVIGLLQASATDGSFHTGK